MSTMRELLRGWNRLEPTRCKLETSPNVDWHEEFELFFVRENEQAFYALVFSDKYPDCFHPNKGEALMRIQWGVQAAIVERGWSFKNGYDSQYGFGYEAEIEAYGHTVYRSNGVNLAEVLLATYLGELKNQLGVTG